MSCMLLFLSAHMNVAEVSLMKPKRSSLIDPFSSNQRYACSVGLGFVEQAGCSCDFTQVGKEKSEMDWATL